MTPRREALGNTLYWLATHGKWVVGGLLALFATYCGLVGWSNAWDVIAGNISPRNRPYPWCGWPVAVVGWLLVPAFVGGVVGYAIGDRAGRRRDWDDADLADAIAKRVQNNAGIAGTGAPPGPTSALAHGPLSARRLALSAFLATSAGSAFGTWRGTRAADQMASRAAARLVRDDDHGSQPRRPH